MSCFETGGRKAIGRRHRSDVANRMRRVPMLRNAIYRTWVKILLCNPVDIFAGQGYRNQVFSDVEHEINEKSDQLTYNLANVNQKLGFSVIGSNLRYEPFSRRQCV